jgi:putative two-component system response regulator
VFDALTNKRPYKEAWSVEKTMDLIKEQSGKHFDPQVVEALVRELDHVVQTVAQWQDI